MTELEAERQCTGVCAICIFEGRKERGIIAIQEKYHEQMLNMEKFPFQTSQNI